MGFADAWHPYIQNLPQIVSPTHELPQNILPDAKTIIAYYVPFTKELAKSNRAGGATASPEWARAYEETNALFAELNEALIDFIQSNAGSAGVTPKATTFYQNRLAMCVLEIESYQIEHITVVSDLLMPRCILY